MEFNQNLLFNFTSVFVTSLLLLVTSLTVFQRLKWRWPLTVNCWFCNKNTKIWRQCLNWWLCPHCEQYNGFTKTGDYVHSIPEQYKTSPANVKYCRSPKTPNEATVSGLCQKCNHYERIKLSKLSEFQPVCERNFAREVEEFKSSLEEKYPLCAKCRGTVHSVLNKQSIWLAQYKMLFFKQKPIRTIINNAKHSETVFRVVSMVLDSMVVYNTELLLLPVAGLFFQLCACWATTAKKKSSDIILAFLWICIILLVPFKDLKLLKTDFSTTWFSIDYVTQYHMIMLFTVIIGALNMKPRSSKNVSKQAMSFKKMDTSPKFKESDEGAVLYSQESKTNTESSRKVLDSPIVMKPIISPIFLAGPEIRVKSPTLGDMSLCKNNVLDNYSLSNLSTFSTLSLSEDQPKYTSGTPKIFEKKVYGATTSHLFKKSNSAMTRKPILSPPKLKSVMQSSWVAGGYWQEGIVAPTLSRSSSQSSGFGSACSNFAPSREPSVHEFDQCSVMSDITQSCYPSRPNSVNSVGSLTHQISPYTITESKTPLYNQTMRFTQNQSIVPTPILLQNHQNGPVYLDPSHQSPRMNVSDTKNSSEIHMFPGHTTIVTSPVWFPALLCGSLVLNIIVLCTTLLR